MIGIKEKIDYKILTCNLTTSYEIICVNEEYCQFYEKKKDELISKNLKDCIPKEDYEEILKYLLHLDRNNTEITYEKAYITNSDKKIWIQWTIYIIFNNYGKKIGFLIIGRDVTIYKNLIHDIEESEKRYRSVVEDQLELICRYTPDCILTFANNAYCKHIGKDYDEILGKSILESIDKDDVKELLNFIKKASPKKPLSKHVQRIKNSQGKILWVEWHRRALFDMDGKLYEIQSVGRDITELKKMEEDLKSSKEELHIKNLKLKQKNIALKELLQQIEIDKQDIKDNITTNVQTLLFPLLEEMKIKANNIEEKYIDLIKQVLENLTSSFGRKIMLKDINLTNTEIKICNMIINGLTNKEIANMLFISINTVCRHRYNIRKKLNILNSKVNLASYLRNLSYVNSY